MVGVMAKINKVENTDDLVLRARTESNALGQLYELYYNRIFRFCVHRLFSKEAAEDVTSTVFLHVARRIRTFAGRTQQDFRNWLYALAANHINAYIRKTSRRKRLLAEAATANRLAPSGCRQSSTDFDWARLYPLILKLKPKYQTLITLRYFENLGFKEIAEVLNIREATIRVRLHRALKKMRDLLPTVLNGEE